MCYMVANSFGIYQWINLDVANRRMTNRFCSVINVIVVFISTVCRRHLRLPHRVAGHVAIAIRTSTYSLTPHFHSSEINSQPHLYLIMRCIDQQAKKAVVRNGWLGHVYVPFSGDVLMLICRSFPTITCHMVFS